MNFREGLAAESNLYYNILEEIRMEARKHLMPYRLIVSDMDDTLLNEKGLLSPATIEAVEAARAAGAELVLASGRMPCAMRSFSQTLKVSLPMIAYNGAELINPQTNESIYRLYVPSDLALELIRYCEELELHVQAYDGDDFLTPVDNELAREYRDSVYGVAHMRVTGKPLSECVTWAQPKLLAIADPDRVPELLALVRKKFDGRLISAVSRPQYIECTSPLAGKERALRELCRQMNIGAEEVVAFGDGQNDVGMIQFAGLGCAMANARAEVRAQADLIAPANHEDGVAQVIMRLIREGKIGGGA